MPGKDLDPEIEKLLADTLPYSPTKPSPQTNVPDFNSLFGSQGPQKNNPGGLELRGIEDVTQIKKEFPEIMVFEDKEKPIFSDPDFYKKVLNNEGEAAKRFHENLQAYMKTQDPQEKTNYKNRVISAWWEIYVNMGMKTGAEMPLPKRYAVRFGAVLPNLLSPEQKSMIARIFEKNTYDEPIYYADEWIFNVMIGKINPSTTDEVKTVKKEDNSGILAKVEKARGQREAMVTVIKGKMNQRQVTEQALVEKAQALLNHPGRMGYAGLTESYTTGQRNTINEINEILRTLLQYDKEMEKFYTELDDSNKNFEFLQRKAEEIGAKGGIDARALGEEINTIRQMVKMSVGRQGNHFPILLQQYFRPDPKSIGTRENVIKILREIEYLDPGLFARTFKNQTTRIVPYIILLPCYGDRGICWEPFERHNRATSKGRIAIPIFPKDLRIAVLTAVADLRWQVAKERAAHYWMEEGITGKYYQWFSDMKLKGDVKEYFIRDYLIWITKESEGTQRLDKEVRGIFWRNIPFPEAIKEDLKKRGFTYQDLIKKDANRAMSDGY